MRIRLAIQKDLSAIAKIHCENLGESFLGSFGSYYLLKFHYPEILTYENSVTVVSEANGVIHGFATFFSDAKWPEQKVFKPRLISILFTFIVLLRRPVFAQDIWALLCAKKIKAISPGNRNFHYPELFTLAISETARGKGIGGELIEFGMSVLKRKEGRGEFCVVKTHTKKLARYYRRYGFKLAGFERRGSSHFAILMRKI